MKIVLALLAHESENGTMQNRYFPLSIGLVSEFIKANVKSPVEISLFKKPSKLVSYLENNDPDIVMFGNYMWIEKLNCYFSKQIKKKNSKTLIAFGGPNLSIDAFKNENFLRENNHVDFLIEGDGEIVAKNIVEAFIENNKDIEKTKLSNIPNTISIEKKNNKVITGGKEDFRIGVGDIKLEDIPSPYTSGAMDIFFEDGAIPLLESNRGCPYSCSFCQQGTTYFSRVRYYDDKRVKDELVYIAKKIKKEKIKMNIVEFTDPNFGMYKNDILIFNHIRQVQDEYAYPKEVWCSSGKSQPDRIMETAKILKKGSIMIRATVQSMNEETLKNVARKNLPVNIFKNMATEGIEIYSDVMLGLPSETKETHIEGILHLIDNGIDEFSMLQTILLKGTEMEKDEYINKYRIKTKYRVIPECDGIYNLNGNEKRITETEKIIYETNTLPFQDYLDCRKFNLLTMIFHNTRLLRPIYKYLDSKNIKRSEILRKIYKHLNENKNPLNNLLLSFEDATKEELSEKDLFFSNDLNLDEIASNKIFKFLTIGLLYYKEQIIELIRSLSLEYFENNKSDHSIVMDIIEKSFLNDYNKNQEDHIIDLNDNLKKIFNNKEIEIKLTKFQKEQIDFLRKQYNKSSDIESKMAYHLRPINMIKNIDYEISSEHLLTKKIS